MRGRDARRARRAQARGKRADALHLEEEVRVARRRRHPQGSAARRRELQTQAARRRLVARQGDAPGLDQPKMVSPTRKRDAVAALQSSYRLTTRRACHLVGHHRSTQYYQSNGRRDATALRARMKEIAAARPRYGYRRIHTLLRREGWKDGIERVYRLYRLDGLAVRSKPRK